MSTPPPLVRAAMYAKEAEDARYHLEDDSDDEYRASAMIAAPPARDSRLVPKYHKERPQPIERRRKPEPKNNFLTFLNPHNLRKQSRNRKRHKKKSPSGKQRESAEDRRAPQNYSQGSPDAFALPPNGPPKVNGKLIKHEDMENVDSVALKAVLRDFYAFHDPVTSEVDLEKVLQWTSINGLASLNEVLKSKYNADLIITESITLRGNKSVRALTVTNRRNIIQSARIVQNLQTPGIIERKRKPGRPTTEDVKLKLRTLIYAIETSESPQELRDCLIDFFKVASPERTRKWQNGETNDFIGTMLSWTFRFGTPKLVYNLKHKYLGEPLPDHYAGEVTSSETEITSADANAPEWRDREYVSKILTRFYHVYNPGRLEKPLTPLIDFIVENGVTPFNNGLMERYSDNLFTFENESRVQWRSELTEKLFSFFSKVDPAKINRGLNNVIYWTERHNHSLDELNLYLRKRYNRDLTFF